VWPLRSFGSKNKPQNKRSEKDRVGKRKWGTARGGDETKREEKGLEKPGFNKRTEEKIFLKTTKGGGRKARKASGDSHTLNKRCNRVNIKASRKNKGRDSA